ncbi:MAG: VOC family protein [Gemmatimonadales bacterium]
MPAKKRSAQAPPPSSHSRPARPPERRQPETLRLRSIAPTITATDLARSIAFYRDVLGFVVGEEMHNDGVLTGAELRAGAITFWLNQDDFARGRDREKGVGLRVWCATAQDIDRLAAEIQARGGMLEQEPHTTPWGERAFLISDPDGFKLAFVQQR